ncbi:unnamed protein product [Prorocentrum cordatum]|uniref:Uncharacterized protein n=1 Tax=Prorocentrum cordatum TaxID=2364126 RepID=A0ABN9WGZ4_9DINO|nr:unnamed protein product [Polarella glacialis]
MSGRCAFAYQRHKQQCIQTCLHCDLASMCYRTARTITRLFPVCARGAAEDINCRTACIEAVSQTAQCARRQSYTSDACKAKLHYWRYVPLEAVAKCASDGSTIPDKLIMFNNNNNNNNNATTGGGRREEPAHLRGSLPLCQRWLHHH